MKNILSAFLGGLLAINSAIYGQKIYDPEALTQSAAASSGSTPHLVYYGGPVIQSIQVYSVLWGPHVNATVAQNMPTFLADLVGNSSVWMTGLQEYNTVGVTPSVYPGMPAEPGTSQTIGFGNYIGQYEITPITATSTTTVSDGEIQAELVAQISAGHLPAPTLTSGYVETIYIIEFPPNLSITMGGSSSCTGFCAYHSDGSYQGTPFMYSVHPDFSTPGCQCSSGRGLLADQQSVHSHEIAESITDPEVGNNDLSWYDEANGEIGDRCAWQLEPVTLNGNTYILQKLWCNATNGCQVPLPGANASPTVSASTSTVVASPTSVTADGTSTSTITVTLKTSGGSGSFWKNSHFGRKWW